MEDFNVENGEFKSIKRDVKKGGMFFKIIIALVLILALIVLGAYSWYKNGITPSNKDKDKEVIFNIKENTTVRELGTILKENGLIKDENAYKIYVKRHKVNLINKGKYKVNKDMSLEKILDMIKKGEVFKNDIKLTIIEGYKIDQIIDTVAKNTKITKEEMKKTFLDKEYMKELCKKYTFLDEKEILNEDLKYPLEGYIAPNTYIFDKELITPKQIIELSLDEMGRILKKHEKRLKEISFNTHEVLTLASIVEKEARHLEDAPLVAGLFINRLNKNMSLGSDPTTHYEVNTPLNVPLTLSQLQTPGKFNTRGPNMEGKLPVGPIASPSEKAISGVLNYKQNSALFFVSDKNGKIYFTNTLEEHKQIIQKLKNENLWQ